MAMDSISWSAAALFALNNFNNYNFQGRRNFPLISTHTSFSFPIRFHGQRRFHSSTINNYKQYDYDYQDFQAYAKPSRLLRAAEPKVSLENLQEKSFASLIESGSHSLFKVKLQTSNASGSSLSDQNAGILLCLIDTIGDSILQRIPLLFSSDESNNLHFQRGSIDEFIFRGPKLDTIEALWIGIESGQWRLGGVSLTVINTAQYPAQENSAANSQITALQYEFEVEDILFGEGCEIAMIELRPTLVSLLSGSDPYDLFRKTTPSESTTIPGDNSMREYTDLKLSLLSYDALLICAGTILANLLSGENEAFAYLTGGIGGFLYLLLLQRSVDGLEVSSAGGTNERFGELKGPIAGLALGIGLGSLCIKYLRGDILIALSSKEILFGMAGFLGCKVAVVLAAFRPISVGVKETENEN